MTRRVVVTGLGVVTPHGIDLRAAWDAWRAGDVAVAAPRRLAVANDPTRVAGEVPPSDWERLVAEWGADVPDARTLFGVAASVRAVADAGLSGGPFARAGVSMGSGPGTHRLEDYARAVGNGEALDAKAFVEGAEGAHPAGLLKNAVDRPAVETARRLGLRGPVSAPTTACAAAAHAVGSAIRAIRSGRADWMVAGGADSQTDPIGHAYFVLLRASATEAGPKASRPFSRRRTGLVIAEGAAAAVLESEEHARARGARIYAEAAGFASTLDAHLPTAPRADGSGIERAMARALADGGMTPDDVDLVSAHATGTKLNDPAEAAAVRRLLGARADRVAVVSGKAGAGHLLAAAAGVSFAAAVLAVHDGEIPPTAHLADVDPLCALDHVVGAPRKGLVRGALVNALAFGGHNASIAVRRWNAS